MNEIRDEIVDIKRETEKKEHRQRVVIHIGILFVGALLTVLGLCLTYAGETAEMRFWWMTVVGLALLLYCLYIFIMTKIFGYRDIDEWYNEDLLRKLKYISVYCLLVGIILCATGIGISATVDANKYGSFAMGVVGSIIIFVVTSFYLSVIFLEDICGTVLQWTLLIGSVLCGAYCLIFGLVSVYVAGKTSFWGMASTGIVLIVAAIATTCYQYIKHGSYKDWFTDRA